MCVNLVIIQPNILKKLKKKTVPDFWPLVYTVLSSYVKISNSSKNFLLLKFLE